MERRPGSPSPTGRSFWRMHAPDFHVEEVYADLSGRCRAVSTRVLRILSTLYHGLWALLMGYRRWSLGRHVRLATPSTAPRVTPVVSLLSQAELMRAFGRSPPPCRSSLIDPRCHRRPLIERGRADECLKSSVTDDCGMLPMRLFLRKTLATRREQTVHSKPRPNDSDG